MCCPDYGLGLNAASKELSLATLQSAFLREQSETVVADVPSTAPVEEPACGPAEHNSAGLSTGWQGHGDRVSWQKPQKVVTN